MNYIQIAKAILPLIGGAENIVDFEHCSTRLRFTLADSSKVKVKELESIEGVIGVRQNVQTQIIIGNDVVEVYDAVQSLIAGKLTPHANVQKEKKKYGSILLDFLIGIFQPLVPALAGAGILRAFLSLTVLFGLLDNTTTTYKIIDMIGQAPLEFLPILVAYTTALKLKVNPIVATSAVATLVLPDMISLVEEGATFFNIPIENIEYLSQVFPPILAVCFYAVMEKAVMKISPKAIRVFFVPMISLLVTVPVTLLILGPLGYNVGSIFATVIIWIFTKLGWIAAALLATVLPLMVMTGMHKAMIPYAMTTYTSLGRELLYLPASLAHNISESGAAFAVSLKSKDDKLKAAAFSGGISALCGITEPAIYAVTVQHKTVLITVMISSCLGGAFIGLTSVQAFSLVSPGLVPIAMFIDPNNSMNLIYALLAVAISFAISFILTFIFFKDEKNNVNTKKDKPKEVVLKAPVEGKIIPLEEVKDDVFASGMAGNGFGIYPSQGQIYAPVNGEIMMVFETEHAIGLKTEDGVELLIHIGINTVNLKGKYFHSFVKAGDKVKVGDKLTEFDLDKIVEQHFDPTVIVVATNREKYNTESIAKHETVTVNDDICFVYGPSQEFMGF